MPDARERGVNRATADRTGARRRRLVIGRWLVDPSADEISADGRVVKLEPQNMRLLLALAEQPGEVLTIQELLDLVWGDLVVTPNSVYQAVAQLRRQLGDAADEPAYIQTVHRKGYRLTAAVRQLVQSEPGATADGGAGTAGAGVGAGSAGDAFADAGAAVETPAHAAADRGGAAADGAATAADAAAHAPAGAATGADTAAADAAAAASDRGASARGAVRDLADATVDAGADAAAREAVSVASAAPAATSAGPPVRAVAVPGDGAASPSPSPALRRRFVIGGAVVAAGAAGLGLWVAQGPTQAPGAKPRLAVLPFDDPSPGRVELPMARGLALDVAGALGRRSDLVLVAAESVQALAEGVAPAEAAARLQARYLLLGELRRQARRIEVAVRLVEPPRAAPLWERGFAEPEEAAVRLPERIAREAAAALGLPVVAASAAASAATADRSPTEAYELYVLGRDAWRPKTTEAFIKAREYFQRGIDADPSFAPNHAGLGWTWIGQATTGAGLPLPRAVALATPAFEKALRLDPDLANALAGKAQLHALAGEFDSARGLLEHAIRVEPNLAQAHHTLGVVEFDSGHPQRAATHFERASALNPLSAAPLERMAIAQTLAGRMDAALDSARRAVAVEPRYPSGHWAIGIHGYATGDLVQAVSAYRQALEREPRRPYLWQQLGWLYADLGLPDAAADAFGRAVQQLPGVRWASVHAAVAWLARLGGPLRAERGSAPAALGLGTETVPEDGFAVDLMQFRLLAGLPADGPLLQRALDAAAARGETPVPGSWFVFQGLHRQLDLAAVRSALGQPVQGDLAAVESGLERLAAQGNRFHALHFHRARLAALRGRGTAALEALEAAAAAGARRRWWWQLDPVFAAVRTEAPLSARFAALVGRVDADLARQRQQLGY